MTNAKIALVAILGTAATLGGAARADGGAPARVTLSVSATGFRNTTGQALFALYVNGDTWLKPDRAFRVLRLPISGPTVQVSFPDLDPGVYAVSVIHDENTNGKLDMKWFPIPGPVEGAGVSNDATATIGPPKYGDARFQLGERGGVMAVKVRY